MVHKSNYTGNYGKGSSFLLNSPESNREIWGDLRFGKHPTVQIMQSIVALPNSRSVSLQWDSLPSR